MNERIQELAEQATTIVEMVGPQGYTSSYANFDREKFAELIIDECVLKLLSMDEHAKGNHNYYKHAALEIKRHFKKLDK